MDQYDFAVILAFMQFNRNKRLLIPLFGRLGTEDMRFVIADGAREVMSREVDRATFLAPHVEAIQALFAADLSAV